MRYLKSSIKNKIWFATVLNNFETNILDRLKKFTPISTILEFTFMGKNLEKLFE